MTPIKSEEVTCQGCGAKGQAATIKLAVRPPCGWYVDEDFDYGLMLACSPACVEKVHESR